MHFLETRLFDHLEAVTVSRELLGPPKSSDKAVFGGRMDSLISELYRAKAF